MTSPKDTETQTGARARTDCQVYWGSHGCMFERGHPGPHECHHCDCYDHEGRAGNRMDDDGEEWLCVCKPPYYGPDTYFYGEDA